jgi:hypothetical protein
MATIALTIIILLNYLAFYFAYGAFKGSVGTKKKRFFSRQKSRRCAPGGGECCWCLFLIPLAGMAEWQKEWQNGRMAEMDTYVLFMVHADTDTNDDT